MIRLIVRLLSLYWDDSLYSGMIVFILGRFLLWLDDCLYFEMNRLIVE